MAGLALRIGLAVGLASRIGLVVGLELRIGLAAAAAQMCRRPVVAVVVGRLPESAAALVVRRPFWLFTHVYLFTHFIYS